MTTIRQGFIFVLIAGWMTGPLTLCAQAWDVNEDRSTYQIFEYEASEGTWLSLDISPDGATIIFDLLGHIYSMPSAGGQARALTSGRSWNNFPRFSPEGERILFTSDRGGSEDLWVMNKGGDHAVNITDQDLPVFQGDWSADGRHIYGTSLNMKVRFPAHRYNFYGDRQEIIPAGEREPVNYFTEHKGRGLLFYEHNRRGDLYAAGGSRIMAYDLQTGKTSIFVERPGGAASPRISPDGNYLSYLHRNDQETVLIIRDLATHGEKVVFTGLDRGRFEDHSFYGCYSNYDWHPNGREIFISKGGQIYAIDIISGSARLIPFQAEVRRKIDDTHRVSLELPTEGQAYTRSHRWGTRIPEGILYEALGDLFLHTGQGVRQLTETSSHETNPVYHPTSGEIYFARWTDDDFGQLWKMNLASGLSSVVSGQPSQYGPVAFSPVGNNIAFIRGRGGLISGKRLEDQTDFELAWQDESGTEKEVTQITWTSNRYGKRPPSVLWGPEGEYLYFTEYEGDVLTLKRIRPDGLDEQSLYEFPHATRVVVSPDFQWMAFREYHRSFITPFEFSGQLLRVSAADELAFTRRVDKMDGDFMEWSTNGEMLGWTRGKFFVEKKLEDILGDKVVVKKTDLSVEYELAVPGTSLALTNARILTMNEGEDILENATILIEGNRITHVGTPVDVPPTFHQIDCSGYTVMPGMFDAHGHYGSPVSALNVIEQRLYGLHANLAYGVTTMYDVYGTTQKDFWVSDMLQAGKMNGPRIFSVGDPVFVTKYRTKMHRPISSLDDAIEIAAFNKDHGATALKDYSNHTRAARQQLIEACRKTDLNLVTESFANPQMNLTQIIDGFSGIEHTMGLTPLYDDVIGLFAFSEIGMTPTLIVVYNGNSGETYFYQSERIWEDDKLLNFYTTDQLIAQRRPTHFFEDDFYHIEMAAEMKKLHDAGVLLLMGAHGQKMGLGAHWEMEMFVQGGFTPYEAIKVATINGFKHHGLDHVLGSIEVGKLADLVILDKNPVEDIRNTRAIKSVMKNGVLYNGFDAHEEFPSPGIGQPMYFHREGVKR